MGGGHSRNTRALGWWPSRRGTRETDEPRDGRRGDESAIIEDGLDGDIMTKKSRLRPFDDSCK